MTMTDQPGALEPSVHDRLGAFAHGAMAFASLIHDGAAMYLKARNKALVDELAQSRGEAAAVAFRAYHLGRFHQHHQVPLPADCVAAAAMLDPATADELVAVVRHDLAPAAAVDDEAPAAAVDELGHQGDEPGRVDEPGLAAAALCDHGLPTPAPGLCDHDETAELGELEHPAAAQ